MLQLAIAMIGKLQASVAAKNLEITELKARIASDAVSAVAPLVDAAGVHPPAASTAASTAATYPAGTIALSHVTVDDFWGADDEDPPAEGAASVTVSGHPESFFPSAYQSAGPATTLYDPESTGTKSSTNPS
jgi:hypothetical protein